MAGAEELKVYALGGRRVVFVGAGQGEGLQVHLGSCGFPAGVVRTPGSDLDRLELERHTDVGAAQAALDRWPG
jgi:hypothetical protein